METVVNNSLAPHQVGILAERAAQHAVGSVQRQHETDRRLIERRFQQLEQKVETYCEERTREADARKKWAEVQGSVNGLLEELYSLARRIETLEQRIQSRTSGLEQVKQRSQELEQQMQALEQSAKLAESAHEEVQKRQSTKIHRTEHSLEELSRRLSKVEEDLQALPQTLPRHPPHSQKDIEQIQQRVAWLEAQDPAVTAHMHHEDLRQRIELMEERHCAVPSKQHCRDVAQAQDSICDLAKQVSCIAQRAGISEAAVANLTDQVHQLQLRDDIELNPSSREGGLSRAMSGTKAELGALSQQVADMAARLVEVEGGLASQLNGHPPLRLSDEHLRHRDHEFFQDDRHEHLPEEHHEQFRDRHHQEADGGPREMMGSDGGVGQPDMAVSDGGGSSWHPQIDGHDGHQDLPADGCSEAEEVLRELSKVRQWMGHLEHRFLVQRSGQCDPLLEESYSSEASPQQVPRRRHESHDDVEVDDLHDHYEELSEQISQELQAKDIADRRRSDFDVLGFRLGKLEDATDLYLSYTKCVASDHADQMEKLGMRLQDMESSHKVVQQVLQEWHLRGDQGSVGPMSDADQPAERRQQGLDRGDISGYHHRDNGRAACDHRFDAELAHRLCAIEERLDASCEMAVARADQVLRRVAEELQDIPRLQDMADHQKDLDEAKASISALSRQMSAIEGRTTGTGPWGPLDNEAIVKRLTPSSALEKALAVFSADFEAQAHWMEAMDDEDLDNMEAALKHMQSTCLQAANNIATVVQGELLSLQNGETPSSQSRDRPPAPACHALVDDHIVEPPQHVQPPRLEVSLGQRRTAMDSDSSSVDEEIDPDDSDDDDVGPSPLARSSG